MPSAHAIPDRN